LIFDVKVVYYSIWLLSKHIPRYRKLNVRVGALAAGFTVEEIFQPTEMDRWFLAQIKGIVDFEEELAASRI
jgi:hypothetical protein